MGYIIEPKGVDFLIEPNILTDDDAKAISAAISNYKQADQSNTPQTLTFTAERLAKTNLKRKILQK